MEQGDSTELAEPAEREEGEPEDVDGPAETALPEQPNRTMWMSWP